MRRWTALVIAFAIGSFAVQGLQAKASEKRGESARHANCCPTASCCPDNYCKKPMPCIPSPNWCGTCDDYCKKPMPCIPSPKWCGTCDDYCKKPFPNLCLTRNWQFYRCPPCECPSAVEAKTPVEAKPAPSKPKRLPSVK